MQKENFKIVVNSFFILIIIGGLFLYIQQQIITASQRMHLNDFKHIYLGATLLAKGGNPYDLEQIFTTARLCRISALNPYVYPPFTGQVLGFLTIFPLPTAAKLWFVLNHIFFWASLSVISISLGLPLCPFYLALVSVLAGWIFPLYRTLTAGQLNCLLLLLIALIWWAHTRQQHFWTGFLTAFASLFKLSPAIFFLYFLWRRQWRTLGYALLWVIILLTFSFLLTPPAVQLDFLPVLKAMSYGHSTWAELGMDFYRDPFNQSFNSLFHHLFTLNPYTDPLFKSQPQFADVLTYFVSALFLVFVLFLTAPRKKITNEAHAEELDFSLFVFLSLLLPSLMWDHYLTLLVFPLFVLAKHLKPKYYAGIIVFALGLVLICVPINFSATGFRHGLGILGMSTKLWATLLLFILNSYFILRHRSTRNTAEKHI